MNIAVALNIVDPVDMKYLSFSSITLLILIIFIIVSYLKMFGRTNFHSVIENENLFLLSKFIND